MSDRDVFLFFPCNGEIGGAERRLVRSFTKIMNTESSFHFTIGLLPVIDINKELVLKNYRTITDTKILFFVNRQDVFNYVKNSNHNCICYTDCSYRCLPVLFAATFSKKKKYMICADTIGSSQNLKPFFRQLLYNFDVRMSDRIDCLYPSSTDILKQKFKKKHITCTPCSFTAPDKYKPLFPKKKSITFLGRLIEEKGIRLFVDAAIKIADEIRKKDYVCEIYGSGRLLEEESLLVEKSHSDDIIRFCGHIDDSSQVLGQSMIFCSLQKYGNYPSQSLLEAIACGNYCIVTDTADSHLLVEDSFGVLVEQNVDALSEALLRAMDKPINEYSILSQHSREFLNANYTLEKSSEYYNAFFE